VGVELAAMAAAADAADSLDELRPECERLETELDKLELLTTLSGKHDASDAYLSIHPGEGGTESCDWASILARMYERFCEKQGWKLTLVDRLDGDEAGIKNATYHVKGDMVYGYLRSEIGVHRLVRKSPFDARNRRHTSFASVDVIPEMPDADKDVEIIDSDLRIDTYRAGGAGGQHVNTTDSAVRITHIPTGIVVQCQNERSQHANKATAMKVLKSRMAREKEREREQELQSMYGEKGEIGFGNQIRNYVLEPYTLAKDRRTGHETGNVQAVLDGELLQFIEAFLRWKRGQQGGPSAPADASKD
jgi:peptide chain release factor 2